MVEQNHGQKRDNEEPPLEPGVTGRWVITFEPSAEQQGLDALRRIGVVADVVFNGAAESADVASLADQEATIYFKGLGIVIAGNISSEQREQIEAAIQAKDNPLMSIKEERINTTFSSSTRP